MNTELQTFNFNSHSFRVITDINGDPWFIAKDVAECLGYQNPAEAIRDNCKKAVNFTNRSQLVVNEIKELHRTKALIIPESDVYRLIMRSKLPSAEDFQTLVCDEILPAIRKTGTYSVQQPKLPTNYLEALVALVQSETDKQSLQHKIETDKPKVEFAEAIRNTDGKVSVGDFAKVIGTGQNRLFERLRNDGFLMANNRPYQHSIDRELLVSIEQKPHIDNNGKSHPSFKTLITGKGQVYFEKRYRNDVL